MCVEVAMTTRSELLRQINDLSKTIDKQLNTTVGGPMLNHNYWPYQVFVGWNHVDVAERFCYDSFKSRNWRNHGAFFGFKNKNDWVWFKLRFQ